MLKIVNNNNKKTTLVNNFTQKMPRLEATCFFLEINSLINCFTLLFGSSKGRQELGMGDGEKGRVGIPKGVLRCRFCL